MREREVHHLFNTETFRLNHNTGQWYSPKNRTGLSQNEFTQYQQSSHSKANNKYDELSESGQLGSTSYDDKAMGRAHDQEQKRNPRGRQMKMGQRSFIDHFLERHSGEESEMVELDPTPHSRLFGPTYGLDHRLFENDRLKPDVRGYILEILGDFWAPLYGPNWNAWSIVYFAGSEASEWTSPTLEGNNDFDVLIGVNYDAFREELPEYGAESDQDISDMFNGQFRQGLNNKAAVIVIDGKAEGPFDNTWYVNPNSYDIVQIKPYAAYNVTNDIWAVHPPHLPDWSINAFPPGVIDQCKAAAEYVKAILTLPEPMRTQQAFAYWQYMHGDRSRAFGPSGEGWYDPSNVIEKWLDQTGLLKQLVDQIHDVSKDPSKGYAPTDWSNQPMAYAGLQPDFNTLSTNSMLVVTKGFPKDQKCKYCKSPATQRVIHSEGMAYVPACGKHLTQAEDDAMSCTPDGVPDPSNIDRIEKVGSFDKVYCPCGLQVDYDQIDGWQHMDGSISHDDEFYPHSVSDLMRISG